MGILKNIKRTVIYHCTTKPEHYVHVDKPKTLQEHRQIQYNNWCKAKRVYNGSYLPKNPDKLKESGKKGWIETTSPDSKTTKSRDFKRKSSGQMVRYDDKDYKKGKVIDEHYHWLNGKTVEEHRKIDKNNKYFNRYGKMCKVKSPESHLAPEDKKYNYK